VQLLSTTCASWWEGGDVCVLQLCQTICSKFTQHPALCWIHDRRELHLLPKEKVLQEFSRFREMVRSGRVICQEGNLQQRKDKDGRLWHFLVVQDKPHLAAMSPISLAVPITEVFVAPQGADPVALIEFDFLVCGFVYFFKKKKNRDALFKFVNDIPTGT
jgi:hypothetical protein